MATYLALANFTEQGLRAVKDTTKRADMVKEMGNRYGVSMTHIWWTLGQYDIVTVCEAKDEVSLTAFELAIASAGNVRLQTLRAFNRDEMTAVLAKLP